MNDKHNFKLTNNAKTLRRNMTKEERRLWYDFLKSLPFTVNRQKVIDNYIVDFYCAQAKTIIELDGSQHYVDEGLKSDALRDAYFAELGIKVLRSSNAEINVQFDRVCTDILQNLTARASEKKKASP